MKAESEAYPASAVRGRFERVARNPYLIVSLAAALIAILLVLWAVLQSDPLVIHEIFLVYFVSLPILVAVGLFAISRAGNGARSWPRLVLRWVASSACAVIVAVLIYGLGWSLVVSHLQSVQTELTEYNYPHFSYSVYGHNPPKTKVHAGMQAIDETVYDLEGKQLRLSGLWKERPIVVEFGSIT